MLEVGKCYRKKKEKLGQGKGNWQNGDEGKAWAAILNMWLEKISWRG